MALKAKINNNLDAIGELMGSLNGIADGINKDTYMEMVLHQAHKKSSDAFNTAAAATASTGSLQHVFEFGVAGVTRGQPKFTNPTAPEARLWIHDLTGRGGNQVIGYHFRPALNRNPQPTTKYTGVASKYLRKLSRRKYVFWNKAAVTESGAEVEIRTKNVSHLFVPFGANKPARNPAYADKHFVWWHTDSKGPIVNQPGETTKGTFTAFWMRWWATAGSEIMEMEAGKQINLDVERAAAAAAKRAASITVKPASHNNPMSVAKRARFTSAKNFGKGTSNG